MKGKIQGFYKNSRYVNENWIQAPVRKIDGLRLDEIQLDVTVCSIKDIDELIELLNYSKACFYVPMKRTETFEK